jgi:hypothetical protein
MQHFPLVARVATLLIITVPNQTGSGFLSTASISSAFVSSAPSTTMTFQYGTSADATAKNGLSTAGYFGNVTSSTGTDVYSFLGLTANTSQNWTNWSCVDLPDPPLRYALGTAYLRQQNLDAAVGNFKQAVQQHLPYVPPHVPPRISLAETSLSRGQGSPSIPG